MKRNIVFAAALRALLAAPVLAEPPAAPAKAWTEGRFTVTYRLRREGKGVVAADVGVRVNNSVHYAAGPTEKLKEHEGVHRRINDAERGRVEAEMAAFRWEGVDLREAERVFRRNFFKRVQDIDRLHRAWDKTHPNP